MTVSRRTLLQTSAAAAATTAIGISGCSEQVTVPAPSESKSDASSAKALLDKATELMLNAYPETSSSAGIDSGVNAGLKSRLTDRSPEGQAAIEADVRDMLGKLNKIDLSVIPAEATLNVEVVRSVFESAAKGFDLPYGDMALLNSNCCLLYTSPSPRDRG